MRLHCQVCGGRIPGKADGTLAKHYRRGQACLGSGRLPYEQDDTALREAAAHYQAIDQRHSKVFYAHHEARKNEPLPGTFKADWVAAITMHLRLERRLVRRTRAMERRAAEVALV